ncbi:hypothetical protein FRB99_004077 [Tulasnella sp. 403]|nr:hypothetical protein FRB99_004077 [Tulasnella sp. 403]
MPETPAPQDDVDSNQENEYEGTSIRWKHFSTSFHLAAKKISMGWTYDDFTQCIPGWSSADPENARKVHQEMSEYVHDSVIAQGESIFKQYGAAEAIDTLHNVIVEARARKSSGVAPGKDAWTKTLDPKTAVRARVMPVLLEEKKRLEESLATLEADNEMLTQVLRDNTKRREDCDSLANQWIDALEEVGVNHTIRASSALHRQQVASEYTKVPEEGIQQWSMDTQETTS